MTQKIIISVQFEKLGKQYYFDASSFPDLKPGDPVIVHTSRGLQLATIIKVGLDVENLDLNGFKPVERPATPQDLLNRQALIEKEKDILDRIHVHLKNQGLAAVKILSTEYSLDGKRLFVLLNTEPSVDLNAKKLQQEIKSMLREVDVELRQLGPRDAAKILGGLGACGLETRCCSKFLTDFASISIRMAKTQDISLTPSEITGMCGRLRCCLIYEYDQYVEAIKTLPKRKRKVVTPSGEGKVIQILPLQQAVIVDLPEVGPRQYTIEELNRAEKISKGEEVKPLPPVEPEPETVISRPEDQVTDLKENRKRKPKGRYSSRRKRGAVTRKTDRRNRQ